MRVTSSRWTSAIAYCLEEELQTTPRAPGDGLQFAKSGQLGGVMGTAVQHRGSRHAHLCSGQSHPNDSWCRRGLLAIIRPEVLSSPDRTRYDMNMYSLCLVMYTTVYTILVAHGILCRPLNRLSLAGQEASHALGGSRPAPRTNQDVDRTGN